MPQPFAKIGILTFHHGENFGSLLQAYALSQVLNQEGYCCEFIDYRPYRALLYYLKDIYLTPRCWVYGEKSKNMRKFIAEHFPLGEKIYYTQEELKSFKNPYDLIICGSDEIWNINSIRKFDPIYFLDFLEHYNIPKVAYAASFGSTNGLGAHRERIAGYIKNFDHLAVRDSNSQRLLEKELGRTSIKVLDPTFLVDFTPIIRRPKAEGYILVYGRLKFWQRQQVQRFARDQNLKIVAAGYFFAGADLNALAVGPEEWLGYFSQAVYVFTDHYHGVIFSILFKKSFTLFPRARKENKIQDLLHDLGLEDRTQSSTEIDYQPIYQKLAQAIATSRTYLKEVLHGTY
ncbi:polysaccharide pyruvyl transferase family protein [Anthocerotibacter panamensis]|uniref:polysaccharide pyruvyl transferase family protein n=1 Tax=Anthocerotibacter panamensis TaxID=2857077 RepID=UPI001C4084A7|nr:polysaccharide pyruvyl transferase family protein [Anthocerotibacter panamensis]